MPLYAFRCPACSERFEALQAFDAPAPACPRCGSAEAGRELSSFVAGPARRGASSWTPAATRRDLVHHHHH